MQTERKQKQTKKSGMKKSKQTSKASKVPYKTRNIEMRNLKSAEWAHTADEFDNLNEKWNRNWKLNIVLVVGGCLSGREQTESFDFFFKIWKYRICFTPIPFDGTCQSSWFLMGRVRMVEGSVSPPPRERALAPLAVAYRPLRCRQKMRQVHPFLAFLEFLTTLYTYK